MRLNFTVYCYSFVQGGLQFIVIVSFRAVYSLLLLFCSGRFTYKCYCFVQDGLQISVIVLFRAVYSIVLLFCSGRFTV